MRIYCLTDGHYCTWTFPKPGRGVLKGELSEKMPNTDSSPLIADSFDMDGKCIFPKRFLSKAGTITGTQDEYLAYYGELCPKNDKCFNICVSQYLVEFGSELNEEEKEAFRDYPLFLNHGAPSLTLQREYTLIFDFHDPFTFFFSEAGKPAQKIPRNKLGPYLRYMPRVWLPQNFKDMLDAISWNHNMKAFDRLIDDPGLIDIYKAEGTKVFRQALRGTEEISMEVLRKMALFWDNPKSSDVLPILGRYGEEKTLAFLDTLTEIDKSLSIGRICLTEYLDVFSHACISLDDVKTVVGFLENSFRPVRAFRDYLTSLESIAELTHRSYTFQPKRDLPRFAGIQSITNVHPRIWENMESIIGNFRKVREEADGWLVKSPEDPADLLWDMGVFGYSNLSSCKEETTLCFVRRQSAPNEPCGTVLINPSLRQCFYYGDKTALLWFKDFIQKKTKDQWIFLTPFGEISCF